MKPKKLRDIAFALPEMFGGWRMADDLERISELPDGTLRVNLLDGTAEHSVSGVMPFHLAEELSAWMKSRLADYEIPLSELKQAKLEVEIQTDKIATDKKSLVSFDFRITSCLTTETRTFERTIKDKHVWHHRHAKRQL